MLPSLSLEKGKLTFILTLLGLIVDVIRLTVEVMDRDSRKKDDDNKKD